MINWEKFCSLDGKVCIVTGGGSGIGAGIANFFADAGGNVIIFDMKEETGAKTVKGIIAQGNKAEFLKCDVTKIDSVEQQVAEVINKYGKIDILVNSAGIARRKTVPDCSEWDWDISVDTMLKGVFLTCKFVIPHMQKRKLRNAPKLNHPRGA